MAPIALAFAVLDLTGSKTDLGLVLTANWVPQLLLVLFGGVFADRLPRRKLLFATQLTLFVQALVLRILRRRRIPFLDKTMTLRLTEQWKFAQSRLGSRNNPLKQNLEVTGKPLNPLPVKQIRRVFDNAT